ncbi:MAG: phospholipid carrier-dependent glycosyltransferase [Chloroflexi bacterium]|nr:phospholipid carrier-dependent glycosyltransferase [Chloroflexota bacterium]
MNRALLVIVAAGLALRLIFGLTQDHRTPYDDPGGDSGWYLANGYALVTGQPPPGVITDVSRLASPPLYFVLIGLPQAILTPEAAVIAVRVVQALLSAAVIGLAYRLAVRLTDRRGVGLRAAALVACSPALIIESGQILTETLFICLLTGGLWLYVESVVRPAHTLRWLIGAGVLLGLATLTRAVLLLFPLGLAIHLLLIAGLRAGARRALILLAIYSLTVGTWTIYSLARWDRFVIAGEGISAFIYIGAAGWDDPEAVDQRLAEQTGVDPAVADQRDYRSAAAGQIGADLPGYLARRVGELGGAILQPHGVAGFPGPSLRALALDWLRADRSVAGLAQITNAEAFWPKLALYGYHYTALSAGLIGLWATRRRWRVALPLSGYLAYTLLIHLALFALPRYLFPATVLLWIFAAAGCAALWDRLTARRITQPATARHLAAPD